MPVSADRNSPDPTFRRLKWLGVLVPLAFLAMVDTIRHFFYPELLHAWPGYVLLAGIVVGGALLFSEAMFAVVARTQEGLAQRNRELLALHEAGLAITAELGLETVLQSVVDTARDLVEARYGALSILGDAGKIELFLTSGITPAERSSVGALPVGRGLLGVVLHEGQRLRLSDLQRDPRAVGFPPNHPPMHSLLAVPVLARGKVVGNLYMTEKEGAAEFTPDDEETLARFATQAALAIENARLHAQGQALAIGEERERIAREMHDTFTQVLGYVNTKAQAAQELLRANRLDSAEEQIGQLAEAARGAYAEVRESILGLRTALGPQRPLLDTLRDYLQQWQDQSGIAATFVRHVEEPHLSPSAELQLLRVVQEALTNARKHAGATRVSVEVRQADGWLEAIVKDNGKGFDPSAIGSGEYPRFGLAMMRERAEAAGGSLVVESTPGYGTQVVARFPTLGVIAARAGGENASAHS